MMETSTPAMDKDMRRKTLLKNAMEASPLRRRSLAVTPAILMEKDNDESERSKRRSLVDMQRRLSNLPQTSASPSLNESLKFGETEMKDHLQICSKLFTENKINSKNAWRLHIIDMLNHMSQKTGTDNLQVASTSLDIGAKVYGIRVDDIHSDGLKLASNMARAAAKQPPQQLDENGEVVEDGNDKENPAAKKKKKKRRLLAGEKNTIVKDPQTLLAPLPKLDSVFFSTRTKADASGIDNLFTNTLKMDNSEYKFMLLSKEKAWAQGSDPVVAGFGQPNRKKYPVALKVLRNFKICVPFSNFYVDEWNPDEEEKQLAAEKSMQSPRDTEVIFDDNGIPIPELDGSIHDIFSNHDNDENQDDIVEEVEFCGHIRNEIAHIVDFTPEVTNQRSEYSYNTIVSTHSGKVIDQIWAGPSHWKLKFIRRSTARFSGQAVENNVAKQGRKKQVPQMVNFTEPFEEFDTTKKLKIKRKPPNTDVSKITLPIQDASCKYMMEHIYELIGKPGVVPLKKPLDTNEVDYEVSAYKYENPNDSQYCAQNHLMDDDGDNGAMDNDMDHEEQIGSQENFLGDNLVDAPEAIPKSYVPYALQAKKMDMKKLKAAVWQFLTQEKEIMITQAINKNATVYPTTFSKLYQEIPKYINAKMKSELSCPLAFVALLHLCNEQNLQLVQHPTYKDFDIKGPKTAA